MSTFSCSSSRKLFSRHMVASYPETGALLALVRGPNTTVLRVWDRTLSQPTLGDDFKAVGHRLWRRAIRWDSVMQGQRRAFWKLGLRAACPVRAWGCRGSPLVQFKGLKLTSSETEIRYSRWPTGPDTAGAVASFSFFSALLGLGRKSHVWQEVTRSYRRPQGPCRPVLEAKGPG